LALLVLFGIATAVVGLALSSRGASAAPSIPTAEYCVDANSFHFNVELSGVPDPDNDVIFRIASDDIAFGGTNMERIEVNFRSPSGMIDIGPLVGSYGSPPDRWAKGNIADFNVSSLGGGSWRIQGSVPNGTSPFVPGDQVFETVIRTSQYPDIGIRQTTVTTCAPASQCGVPYPIAEFPNAIVVLTPDSGPKGTQFQVSLSGIDASPSMDEPVEAYWDADVQRAGITGQLVGQGTIPETHTTVDFDAQAPGDAAAGQHMVTVCWRYTLKETWYYKQVPFDVTEPTPTPTPTPSPTPTPTPTPTPLPTPHSPTPTPFNPLFQYYPFSPLVLNYLAPFTPTEDLSIFGIEITEGIQCFDTSKGLSGCPDNSLPLVAQKDATARIYLRYDGLGLSKAGIPVRLHLFAGGEEYIVNASGRAYKTLDQSVSDNPNVWFNVDFFNGADVSFYAEVDPDHHYLETTESNNRFPASGTSTVHFTKRRMFNIAGWRLHYHPSGYSGTQNAGGWAVNGGGADWMEAVWPVRSGTGINYWIKSGYLDWTTTLDGAGQHALISAINGQWILDNYFLWLFGGGAFTGANQVYGWAPSQGYSGGHADMPIYPHAGGLGVVGIGSDAAGSSVDSPGSGALIMGHELTHDYNVYHTNTADACGSNDGNSDFPYSSSSIQEFGYNPDTGKVYTPSTTHDLMSYCPSGSSKQGWISPFTWNKMFGLFAASEGDVSPQTVIQGTESFVVSATIDNPDIDGDQGGHLNQLYHMNTDAPIISPPAGTYAIELRNGSQVLGSQSFEVNFQSEYSADGPGDPTPLSEVDMSFTMAWAPGATSVALVHGGQTLDEVAISPHAPTVQVTYPASPVVWQAGTTQTVSWQGSDADNDPLTYSLFYGSDATNWAIIASGLTSASYPVAVDSLAGSASAHFRVVATDGVNAGFGESAAITVPNKPPYVEITDPLDGAVLQEGDLAVLQGSATDLEDGQLSDASLVWSSDKDGDLGTGESLPINTLSPGQHTITLTATDSNDASASQSITLVVGVRGSLQVLPNSIDPAGTDNVTAIVTLPPGIQTTDINTSSLHVHIGSADLTPLATAQLGDTNTDGLPELKLTLDGQATRAALGASQTQGVGAPHTQVEVDLSGSMNDGTALAANGSAALITPGDVNCSGATDGTDVTLALGYGVNLGLPDCLFAGDLNCDGEVTVMDVLGILGRIAGVTISAASCPVPSAATTVLALSGSPASGHDSGFGSAAGDFGFAAWLAPAFVIPALVIVRRRR
jgi:hypothetical protein